MSDQDQADIGQEMTERELHDQEHEVGWLPIPPLPEYAKDAIENPDRVPTGAELVSELLTQCGWYIDDLAQVDNVALLVDLPREELAPVIRDLDTILQLVGVVRDECAQALANLMEDDHEAIAGLSVERSRYLRTDWDKDGAWRAARASITERWAMDGNDFDTHKAEMIGRTLSDVLTGFTVTPKVAGLKAIGVDPNEWRATTRSGRYTLKVK